MRGRISRASNILLAGKEPEPSIPIINLTPEQQPIKSKDPYFFQ
jgi:hypothetical protein